MTADTHPRIHAHARGYRACTWTWDDEDVTLTCSSPCLPGEAMCFEHVRQAESARRFEQHRTATQPPTTGATP